MRCRDIEVLWDEIRGECTASLKEAVTAHLQACPPCQELYREYEGVAYRLSSLPQPEPSCDLTRKVVEHIALLRSRFRGDPLSLAALDTPIGRVYVGFAQRRIAYLSLDDGSAIETVCNRAAQRLRRPVRPATPAPWVREIIERYFRTWKVDESLLDLDALTPFERATLRVTMTIPAGEVRSYQWIADRLGSPRAVRAVARAIARNPVPFFIPCHRVLASDGSLRGYAYGTDLKQRLLSMEGWSAAATETTRTRGRTLRRQP
jgi:methylated-DNA-[protein]-cysteine S-methyltransferase